MLLLLKKINSSINDIDGSLYTTGIPITWQAELIISIPSAYENNWAEITKPVDWNITQILDGYDVDPVVHDEIRIKIWEKDDRSSYHNDILALG